MGKIFQTIPGGEKPLGEHGSRSRIEVHKVICCTRNLTQRFR